MRLDTDSADLRARLAQVEAERDATQRETAELRRRLAEMVEQASQPRGVYVPSVRVLDGRAEPDVTITTSGPADGPPVYVESGSDDWLMR